MGNRIAVARVLNDRIFDQILSVRRIVKQIEFLQNNPSAAKKQAGACFFERCVPLAWNVMSTSCVM